MCGQSANELARIKDEPMGGSDEILSTDWLVSMAPALIWQPVVGASPGPLSHFLKLSLFFSPIDRLTKIVIGIWGHQKWESLPDVWWLDQATQAYLSIVHVGGHSLLWRHSVTMTILKWLISHTPGDWNMVPLKKKRTKTCLSHRGHFEPIKAILSPFYHIFKTLRISWVEIWARINP